MRKDTIATIARGAAALALALAMATAVARQAPPPDPTADPQMIAAGFLRSHPDLRFRLAGVEALREERHADAFRYFQRAAYYGDKPSQGMVAELYWSGNGVEQDRALAYAWMDLAAERGYRPFVIHRERYWEALDEATRARALEAGEAVYARYGDAATKPRIASVLRRARREAVGGLGAAGPVTISIPGAAGSTSIDASKFYDPTYWDPEKYEAWHDATWQEPRTVQVSVGDVENAGSRGPAVAPEVDAPEPEIPAEPPPPAVDGGPAGD
ncbi:MAG: sel1 repeat family protein [Gammaproteobacteria bacterium]|nr:sel1 repeat family protein [Gammaproteobacteria bacterium]